MKLPLRRAALLFTVAAAASSAGCAVAAGSAIQGLHSEAAAVVYEFNASYLATLDAVPAYEEGLLLAALSGLANRLTPQLFVHMFPSDDQWRNMMFTPFPGWLNGSIVVQQTSITGLLQSLSSVYNGVVLYDPSAYPSSAVASTAAGVEDLLPICYRPGDNTSLYSQLVAGGPQLPVKRSLVGLFNASGTGSVKLNAYTWAVNEYLLPTSPLQANAGVLGYYVDYYATTVAQQVGDFWDKATVPNVDYVIAHRGFAFDLGVWDDEAPIDDPNAPLGSDLAAFKLMLSAAYNFTGGSSMIHITGFTPWAYKYVGSASKHAHGGVDAEWATSVLISAYNAYVDGDACCIGGMANAAFWQHYPLPKRLVQAPPPSKATLISKGLLSADGTHVPGNKLYWMLYMGDYDSAAWLSSQLLGHWTDPARGSVPLGWALDPELSLRFPPIFPLLYNTSHPGVDVLITGDSGAGYNNPTALYGLTRALISGLPDGRSVWQAWNTPWYRQMDMSLTGFIITGDAPQMDATAESMYANFSGDGIVNQGWPSLSSHLNGWMPVLTQEDIPTTASDAAAAILANANASNPNPLFKMFRSVLTSPSYIAQVASLCNNITTLVDPLSISYMMRVAYGGSNDNRVGYVADTLPDPPQPVNPGQVLQFAVTIRNEGWNVLAASNHSIALSLLSDACHLTRSKARGTSMLNVAGSSMKQRLHRYGWRCAPVSLPAAATTVSLFPFPSDLPLGGTITVPVTLTVPSFLSGDAAAGLISLQYQVAEVDGSGNFVKGLDAYGVLPWQDTLPVAA